MIRSVLAVVAGIVVLTVFSFGIEAAVTAVLGPPVGVGLRLITMAYTLACVAAGGFATASVAQRSPVAHAVALGVVQALMTIALWMSGTAPGNPPVWQWIVGIALLIPAAWWGGTMVSLPGRRRRGAVA